MALKGLLGGAAGAAMYTTYRDADTLLNSSSLLSGLMDSLRKGGGGSSLELSRLQKNVEDLQHALLKSLHDRQPTVIYAGNSKSGLGTAGGVVLIVGGVALYLRLVKGWRLADLMYVTRASLSTMSENMRAGMEAMRGQFEERAAALLERMAALGSKQEELLDAQGALGNELALVGGKVSVVSEQVGFSNHAILLLCGALSEMGKRVGISNGRYVKELEALSRSVHSLPSTAAAGGGGGLGMAALPGGVSSGGGGVVGGSSMAFAAPAAAGAAGGAAGLAQLPAPNPFGVPNPSMHAVTAGLGSSVPPAAGPADEHSRAAGSSDAKPTSFGLWGTSR